MAKVVELARRRDPDGRDADPKRWGVAVVVAKGPLRVSLVLSTFDWAADAERERAELAAQCPRLTWRTVGRFQGYRVGDTWSWNE